MFGDISGITQFLSIGKPCNLIGYIGAYCYSIVGFLSVRFILDNTKDENYLKNVD